ncbi:MAG: hypothetical protein ARM1_0277 [Candidatus Micrarchaeota archaeon]|nr:MAG: hypothetical protein ARM1_0277 [Candidatus Micrarchaeota archaeon]
MTHYKVVIELDSPDIDISKIIKDQRYKRSVIKAVKSDKRFTIYIEGEDIIAVKASINAILRDLEAIDKAIKI